MENQKWNLIVAHEWSRVNIDSDLVGQPARAGYCTARADASPSLARASPSPAARKLLS